MMRPIDYLKDARDILLRKYSYKDSELKGLVDNIRREPRCYLGLHYPFLDVNHGQWFMDPGEPCWVCRACDKEPCYDLRSRLQIALEETRLGRRYLDWDYAIERRIGTWRGTWCAKHDLPISDEYPCEGCRYGWDS